VIGASMIRAELSSGVDCALAPPGEAHDGRW
jgi:hypothetical protein